MGKVVNCRSLKVSLITGLFLYSLPVFSQLVIKDTLHFSNNVSSSSIDRIGNLYLSFQDGTITKFNGKMDSLVSFSPVENGEITLLEASHGFQIFAFYEEFQKVRLMNRFLTLETQYYLPDFLPDYVNLCTLSGNQNLWVYNESDFKLMKINLYTKEILLESPLEFLVEEDESQVVFMQEYQNKLFVLSKNSNVYIFDNLGNYLNKLETPQIVDISFKGDNLYYLSHESIHIKHLYKGTNSSLNLPVGNYTKIEIMDDNSLLIINDQMALLTRIIN